MKIFENYLLALFTILLCFSACSGGGDDPIEPTPKPEVIKSEITIDSSIISNGLSFTNEIGEQSISFSTNENWTLSVANTTSGSTWCTASITSGTKGSATVKFTVTENTDYENRSVSVTIKSGTASKTFTITQKCADALLVTTNKYEVAQEGGQIEIEVKANIDYEMEISETAKSWITESSSRALTTYKHKLNIAMNENSEKREGEISFKSGNKIETVKVYQAGGAIILLSQDEYTVSDAGETISVEIKSNVEYGVQMPDVDWISDEASSRGMSSHTLNYHISPNEDYDSRSAEIIFYDKNSDLKDTLKVIQAQKDAIILSQKMYEVEAEGGTIEVKISSNIDFELILPDVNWISQTTSRALTEHTLFFKISKNEESKSRLAKIVLKDKNSELSETLLIKQLSEYGNFEFRDHNHSIAYIELYKAGTLSKTFDSNTNYDERVKIVELKVVGPINGNDISYLRFYKLNLDISEATIVEGEYDFWYEGRPDTFTSIKAYNANNMVGDNMFCFASFTGITLPQNATSIGKEAFYNCPYLTYVDTGNGITSIGDNAFAGCYKLWRIRIGSGVTSIGEGCFQGSSVSSIVIPDNVTYLGLAAFNKCLKLKSVTIGHGLTSIDDYTFNCCESLASMEIPDNITSIGELAFGECSSLSSVNIGNGVISIGKETFRECNMLKSVSIGKNVKTIGSWAFYGCSISNFYSYATTPPELFYTYGSPFKDGLSQYAKLYVTTGNSEAYKTSSWANHFTYIIEMEK